MSTGPFTTTFEKAEIDAVALAFDEPRPDWHDQPLVEHERERPDARVLVLRDARDLDVGCRARGRERVAVTKSGEVACEERAEISERAGHVRAAGRHGRRRGLRLVREPLRADEVHDVVGRGEVPAEAVRRREGELAAGLHRRREEGDATLLGERGAERLHVLPRLRDLHEEAVELRSFELLARRRAGVGDLAGEARGAPREERSRDDRSEDELTDDHRAPALPLRSGPPARARPSV